MRILSVLTKELVELCWIMHNATQTDTHSEAGISQVSDSGDSCCSGPGSWDSPESYFRVSNMQHVREEEYDYSLTAV